MLAIKLQNNLLYNETFIHVHVYTDEQTNQKLDKYIRDLKQPRRRAEWTPSGSVLTRPATSAHVSDVVHMAFRAQLLEAWLALTSV